MLTDLFTDRETFRGKYNIRKEEVYGYGKKEDHCR